MRFTLRPRNKVPVESDNTDSLEQESMSESNENSSQVKKRIIKVKNSTKTRKNIKDKTEVIEDPESTDNTKETENVDKDLEETDDVDDENEDVDTDENVKDIEQSSDEDLSDADVEDLSDAEGEDPSDADVEDLSDAEGEDPSDADVEDLSDAEGEDPSDAEGDIDVEVPKKSKKQEKLSKSKTKEEEPPKKRLTKKELTKKLKGIKIQIVSNDKSSTNDKDKVKGKKKPIKKKEYESEDEDYEKDTSSSEDESESSSDDESNVEEEYLDWVPKKVKKNPRQLHKVKGLIMDIEEKTVSVEKLLSCKIRKKYKSEIFEWIMIYENSMPLSEERKALRKQIYDMFEMYKKEYSDYKLHKKEIKEFEKRSKDFNEMHDIQYKILRLDTKEENKEAIYRKYLELMDKSEDENEEFFKLKSWIQMALQLPFDKIKEFPSFCSISKYLTQVKQILDQELYGMEKVKEQLLLFIHGKLVNPDIKGCCLGLVGPPGVGKTSIARCLARVMDFPFEQITFGGVNSAEFIRGFDYTYVGSRPGEIVRCLSRMKYKNGILFFDEYEKISQNKDITACLLHITDFTQNNTFRDNYLHDLTIDLSSLWFVYSMNALPEDEALKDRIFVINVDGYKEEEKVRILCDYLLPKHLRNLNLQETDIIIDDEMAKYFIRKVSPQDKGIRTMEKYLKDILSKTSFLVTNQDTLKCSFSLPKKYYPLQFPVTLNENMLDIFLKDAIPKSLNLSFYI